MQKGHACRQAGFSSILVIVGVALILLFAGFFAFKSILKSRESIELFSYQGESSQIENSQTAQDSNEPPLKLKNIGVNLDYYDPATNKAGDFVFTKQKLQFNRLFMGYGFFIPASPDNPSKSNPQPTFILPLGTKVRSLVDGIVVDIPTVWSGDYSVMVGTGDDKSPWRYETEHVINVVVKVGDKVKAGQVVAEVSDFDKGAPEGYGTVEIGILRGGQTPEHLCPFAYLDPIVKDDILSKLKAYNKAWEDYIGDQALYEENDDQIPGCLTLDPIEG